MTAPKWNMYKTYLSYRSQDIRWRDGNRCRSDICWFVAKRVYRVDHRLNFVLSSLFFSFLLSSIRVSYQVCFLYYACRTQVRQAASKSFLLTLDLHIFTHFTWRWYVLSSCVVSHLNWKHPVDGFSLPFIWTTLWILLKTLRNCELFMYTSKCTLRAERTLFSTFKKLFACGQARYC